jgi:acyl-CoA thioester hydrolase
VTRLHSIGVRVYYEDTDAGGIVYYANYLKFFERARTDWLRAAGITHQELSQVEGLNLVVRECAVQYLRPARLDDLLAIEVAVADPATDIGRASLRLTQRALLLDRAGSAPAAGSAADRGGPGRGADRDVGAILATGTVRIACLATRTGRPVALPRRVALAVAGQVSGTAQQQDPLPATPSFSPQVTRVEPDGTAEQQ